MKMYVLTGGPNCGKTSILRILQRKGYAVIEESARKILEEKGCRTFSGDEFLTCETEIFLRQVEQEQNSERNGITKILDRSLIDVVAYSRLYLSEIPKEFSKVDLKNRYSAVFLFERLPFVDDGLRMERNESEAEKIHQLLIETYNFFGYDLIHIPAFNENMLDARAEFIISHIQKLKGGGENGRML